VREGAENLGPDDAEVAHVTFAQLGEAPVEDVAEQVHAQTHDDCLTSSVAAGMLVGRANGPG
jgi:hypothetical protein